MMIKIIITDDEQLELKSLEMMLSQYPEALTVKKANNAKQTFKHLETFDADLIFMDIKMPGEDGVTASKRIKAISPYTKVIMLTAHDEFTYAQEALRSGIDDYLLKPTKAKEIYKVLDHQVPLINKHKAEMICQIQSAFYKETSSLTEQAKDYVNKHLNETISVEYLANLFNVSTAHLSRTFKKETGETLVHFISKKKMEYAATYLVKTDLPIVNIALELGYKDTNYFTKVFKNIHNMTPSAYRKKHQ